MPTGYVKINKSNQFPVQKAGQWAVKKYERIPYWYSELKLVPVLDPFLVHNIDGFLNYSVVRELWDFFLRGSFELMTWELMSSSYFFRDSDKQTTTVISPFIRPEKDNIWAPPSNR